MNGVDSQFGGYEVVCIGIMMMICFLKVDWFMGICLVLDMLNLFIVCMQFI